MLLLRMKQLIPFLLLLNQAESAYNYNTERQQMLQDEKDMFLGSNITLTSREEKVNKCLMQHKLKELDNCQLTHFFKYKDNMQNSKVYKFIKDLPKGAALHLHDVGILGPDYLMNLTRYSHLYGCFEINNTKFKFSNVYPSDNCDTLWLLIGEARSQFRDNRNYDTELRKHFTMAVSNPRITYPTINESWRAFLKYFDTVISLVSFRPVWEQYFYDALKAFRDDNVMYIEIRGILPQLYEIDGTVHDILYTAQTYEGVIKKFVRDYPDFIGAKFIYSPLRNTTITALKEHLRLAQQIKKLMPDIFAGFDLVGPEEKGRPLLDFVQDLSLAANNMTYFFHAGETNWYGSSIDENLVDAILLGTKRIGHAYALTKHPLLMKEVLKRDIALEVNVISNNVLSLMHYISNHPLAILLAEGMPVVLSSDDPGAWEAEPLSDDFYVAFMGAASRWADLRLLKQLALNSLKYSALNDAERTAAFRRFNNVWDSFVQNFRCSKY